MLLRAGGELASGDRRGRRAVARSRRAGPRPRSIARRQDPDVRQLRYFGNPLVARTQRRRRRAALPRRRRQRGRPAQRRRRHRRRRFPHRHLESGRANAADGSRRTSGAGGGSRSVGRRALPGLGILGPYGASVAARRRGAAPARGPFAERQWCRIYARRAGSSHGRLRRDVAHLAAVRRRYAVRRRPADAPQCRCDFAAESAPIVAIALSGDGRRVAAAGVRGSVTVLDRAAWRIERTLIGPGTPVWSVVFLPDNRTLLAGGADRMIRRWDTVTGEPVDGVAAGGIEDPLAAYAGDPGAEVFRACIACHALGPDGGNRAGPTLAGIFGRPIATLPGYNFSPALKALDIVWTPETVSRLFEIGPATFTPGTKMPEQRIGSAADRAALVHFLAKATAR